MNLSKSHELFGYPALEIRRLMREARVGDRWDAEFVRATLRIAGPAADVLINQLLAEGLIVVSAKHNGIAQYELTISGNSLAMASAAKRIKRATAERLVVKFLERVAAVNQDPGLLYWVDEVIVFGSYLSDSETLGDIDLAVLLQPRVPIESVHWKQQAKQRVQAAEDQGRMFRSFFDDLFWPRREVELRLKNRSGSLSIHDLGAERSFIEKLHHQQLYKRAHDA